MDVPVMAFKWPAAPVCWIAIQTCTVALRTSYFL